MILKNVEAKILQVEGFKVCFLKDGSDVHGNLEGLPTYPYYIAAPNKMTAKDWVDRRFKATYPGFDVRIYDYKGTIVTSMQTTLATIRGK